MTTFLLTKDIMTKKNFVIFKLSISVLYEDIFHVKKLPGMGRKN